MKLNNIFLLLGLSVLTGLMQARADTQLCCSNDSGATTFASCQQANGSLFVCCTSGWESGACSVGTAYTGCGLIVNVIRTSEPNFAMCVSNMGNSGVMRNIAPDNNLHPVIHDSGK